MASNDKLEEALLDRIMQSDNVDSKEAAIRIAKEQGMIRQEGDELVLTEKGKKAAKKAMEG